MNIGTTSIDSLPLSPQSGDNIRLEMNEPNVNVRVNNPAQDLQKTRNEDPAVMQSNLNQFVTGIQQASAAGLTLLPSRDIPQNQEHLLQDVSIKPNFIPPPTTSVDYIRDYQTNEEIIRAQAYKQEHHDSLDYLYEQIQTPLLIGVLYFIFQLPIVRKTIFHMIPSLFNKDGNPNLSGYIVNSVAFAGIYFILTKGIHFLDK